MVDSMTDPIKSDIPVPHRGRRYAALYVLEPGQCTDIEVVGSLAIQREQGRASEHVATLGMSVSRDWRERGIGSSLLAEALRWARSSGVEKVTLTVYPGNTRAAALYRKFGFVEEGRLSGQSRKSYGYEDEIIMSKWLVER